jgi:indolepyruvate ferredoxin oxidoreductase beta subunit
MTVELGHDPLNIIICGVGGQGNILASELLASALVEKGFYTTVGETYGASQRGGSVMSHVRVSLAYLFGPLIPLEGADIIVGFEPIETLRVVRVYANGKTQLILNTHPNYPMGVLNGRDRYPEIKAIEAELSQRCGRVYSFDASRMAIDAGDPQTANVTLLGAMAALDGFPLEKSDFEAVLASRLKGNVLALNLSAFAAGYDQIAAEGKASVKG